MCRLIGVAKAGWNVDQLRRAAADGLEKHGGGVDPRPSKNSAVCCDTLTATTKTRRPFSPSARSSAPRSGRRTTLAIPPALFELVVEQLAKADCSQGARVIVEKPFGHEPRLGTGTQPDLLGTFDEKSIFRIDHYSASGGAYMVFSVSRTRSWSRFGPNQVESVQITWREKLRSPGRGAFYDPTGTIRDVVQNHLFQILLTWPWNRREKPIVKLSGRKG